MAKKKKICPNCGSSDFWTIVYGYIPNFDEKEFEKSKLKLGGCCVEDDSPKWECADCTNQWK